MRRPGRLALVLLLVLAAPLSAAAPGQGSFTVTGLAGLVGPVEADVDAGAFAARALDGPAPGVKLVLEARSIEVVRVSRVQRDAAGVQQSGDFERERATFENARLSLAGLDAAGVVAILGTYGEGSRFASRDATLLGVERAHVARAADAPWQGRPDGDPAVFALVVDDAIAVGGARADVRLTGELRLFIDGATVTVGDRTFDTGRGSKTLAPGVTESRLAHLVVVARGASLSLASLDAVVTWLAPAPALAVDGSLVANDAVGRLDVDRTRYDAAGDALTIQGSIVVEPRRVPSASKGLDPYQDAVDQRLAAAVAGDVRAVTLAGRTLVAPTEVAAAVGGLALVAAAAWFWPALKYGATVALVPLYSRLAEPRLLENGVRAGIFRIVQTNPGISARAVHRASGQSWGTVVYHLRLLERHHRITSRRVGRSRHFYENHGKYKGVEVEIVVLKGPKAEALARAVTAAPGVTQDALTERMGLPQSTVSYHLQKLVRARLVDERRDGKFVRYHATESLTGLLARLDASSTPPATATVA